MAVGGAQPAGGVTRSIAVLEAMNSAPAEMTKELDRPFGERVLEPLQARALTLGKRLSGADSSDRIRHKLDLAGNPRGWTVDRVVSGKVIGAIALALVGLALALVRRHARALRILALLVGLGDRASSCPTSTSTSAATTAPSSCSATCPTPST